MRVGVFALNDYGSDSLQLRDERVDTSAMNPISMSDPALTAFAAHASNGAGMQVLKKAMDAGSSAVSQLVEQLPAASLDPAVGKNLDRRI
jgi:Putative motility protein